MKSITPMPSRARFKPLRIFSALSLILLLLPSLPGQNIHQLASMAEKGDIGAQLKLGYYYQSRNLIKAAEWWTKAAEGGHPAAQYNLGLLYQNGQGVPKDFVKAFQWYSKAAEQGDFEAKLRLSESYEDARGVLQDNAEALEWANKALKGIKKEMGGDLSEWEKFQLIAKKIKAENRVGAVLLKKVRADDKHLKTFNEEEKRLLEKARALEEKREQEK